MAQIQVSPLSALPANRRRILELLKDRGHATTMQLAAVLAVSHEGVRKHLIELVRDGFVQSDCGDGIDNQAAGRPPVRYCLTETGDHFFPKDYQGLTMLLLDAMRESSGGSAEEMLDRVTRKRRERLPMHRNADQRQRIESLRNSYVAQDPFIEIASDGGDYLIVEKNCPYLSVALERPIICSTTVSMMRSVAGLEVVREERFQDGDGRCVFRAMGDKPVRSRERDQFEIEPPKPQM